MSVKQGQLVYLPLFTISITCDFPEVVKCDHNPLRPDPASARLPAHEKADQA